MSGRACSQCGAPIPPEARFCPNCGAPVAAVTTEERKMVTVLFADVAGSTELAARLDPERFREVIGAFYRAVSMELESLRGRAEKFVGDAVMAVFGLTHTHEDDALRAIRAALAIRDRAERLGDHLGLPVPLRVRVGVNSGPVATGSGPAGQFLVSGAAVNLAARLQGAADPGEVLAGETTWQLTRHAVEFGQPRTVSARGFEEEMTAWPVEALSTRSSRRTIKLVGRRRELALLADAYERARETRRSHLVTLLGEPGIGKTRLIDEFLAGLPDEVRVLSGRASEFEEDLTFAPIADMIRRELGVERGAPTDKVRHRLEELVSACCLPSETERVVARLGLVLGIGTEHDEGGASPADDVPDSETAGDGDGRESGREAARYRGSEIRAGLLELLEGMANQGSVVLVLDDLHLAQPDLLSLVEQVLRGARRLPVLMVCGARDELLEVRAGWSGGVPDSLIIRLDPLTLPEATELAEAAGDALDHETAERIARHAGGNPFFIVETTGMILQVHPEHLVGAAHSHILPPTVQAVVASRIDHLPDDARELARMAAVFPRATFTLDELALITEPSEDILKSLEAEEVLVRDEERPEVWRFRHDIFRDVAYESLPKRERLRLHLAAADGIKSWGGERFPQSVAYHLAQAARSSLDLDPDDRELADRAMEALKKAGDRARWRMESRAAVELYELGLSLAKPRDRWGVWEAKFLSAMGEARYWLAEYGAARDLFTKALKLGGESAWVRALASRFLGDIALNVDGQPERATELFDQAVEAARETGDPWTIARALLMAAWAPYWRSDRSGAEAMFEEALRIARSNPEGDAWAEARALTGLASVSSQSGTADDTLALALQALDVGRKMDDAFTVAVAQEQVANSLRRAMRLEEALRSMDQAVSTFRHLGARWEQASAQGERGRLNRLLGNLDASERDLREALDICRELRERSLVSWTAAQLAYTLMARGDRPAARRVLEESAAADTGEPWEVVWAQAVMALGEGDRERGRELAAEVMATEREHGWRNNVAATVWSVGRLFGAETVGGEEELERARAVLQEAGWQLALKEPDILAELAGV